MKAAVSEAKAIFVGGGNTFLLVEQLYKLDLMFTLKQAVFSGTKYLGTSAGSNICGLTMQTTNDMPIIYPPSFETLGLFNFNINPHYLDADNDSLHKGESRETRIEEFLNINNIPVVGLREGSWLEVKNTVITLRGSLQARVFEPEQAAYEINPQHLLKFN